MITLRTERLIVRPLKRTDAAALALLLGDARVASMLADIALPFSEATARRWLKPTWIDVRLGVESDGRLIGGVSYHSSLFAVGGLGYWLGRDHWGRGYAREAAAAVLRYGFSHNRLQKFLSGHFIDNPASGRVLTGLGFRPYARSLDWCEARGATVESLHYMLPRAEAGYAPARSTLAGWLGVLPIGINRGHYTNFPA